MTPQYGEQEQSDIYSVHQPQQQPQVAARTHFRHQIEQQPQQDDNDDDSFNKMVPPSACSCLKAAGQL